MPDPRSLSAVKPPAPVPPFVNGTMPRRIVVTGSAGFLGKATVACLASLPATELVAGIDLRPTVGPGPTTPVVSVVRDVRAPLGDVLEGYGAEAVVHLAYLLRTDRDQQRARSVNVNATESLLKACAAAGVKQVVYLSSTTVYGARAGSSRPFREDDPANPVRGFQYSEHKVEAERLLMRYADEHSDTAVSILRGCVIMAPGAGNFIARALGMKVLPAPAGANPDMQFLHLDDYLSAVAAALAQHARGIYNIAGEGTVPWRQVATIAGARLVPVPAPILSGVIALTWGLRVQSSSPACGLNLIRYPWLASTEKAKTELGWKPARSSLEALQTWAGGRRQVP